MKSSTSVAFISDIIAQKAYETILVILAPVGVVA